MIRALAALAALLCCGNGAAPADPAAARFDAMKALVGNWRRADAPASPLRVRFALTAGGTVLVESWSRGDEPHSMTVYHRDGPALIATHYCPQGNQPRLALLYGPDGPIRFAFRDATDLDAAREAHVTSLSFDLSAPGQLVRRESYHSQGKDKPSELRLVREP